MTKQIMMKKIHIRNLGPLKEAELELKRINVVIGQQSSGKSCVLKTASYCTWVEKQIELAQSHKSFAENGRFIRDFVKYHKLDGYVREDTYIGYESDYMVFSYDNKTRKFDFEWKEGRWDYRRPQISYIPSERNLVGAIPNWMEVKFGEDNIRGFIIEWERARKAYTEGLRVLNLGVDYKYVKSSQEDKVEVGDGVTLDFTNTSSGLQSLIPLFVHLDYISGRHGMEDRVESISQGNTNDDFLMTMYNELFEKKGKTKSVQLPSEREGDGKIKVSAQIAVGKVGQRLLGFSNDLFYQECLALFRQYTETDHCDIFIEEPENNLFPPTQSRLAEWLVDLSNGTDGGYRCDIFIATHSPYLLTSFLEKQLDSFALAVVGTENGLSTVKIASEEDMRSIYEDGVDAFFNIESLTSGNGYGKE